MKPHILKHHILGHPTPLGCPVRFGRFPFPVFRFVVSTFLRHPRSTMFPASRFAVFAHGPFRKLCLYTCMCIYIYIYIYIHIHTYIYIYTHTCIHTHVYIYIYIYTLYVCIYTRIYIYIYIYMYIHFRFASRALTLELGRSWVIAYDV